MAAQPASHTSPQAGRKTAIRLSRLTTGGHGPQTLAAAELHGKRLDASSQSRRISHEAPLVRGGLNLAELYQKHTSGCRMDKRLKSPIIHAILQWPTGLPTDEETQKAMLHHSMKFLNDVFGGEAAFAGRLDRDESNRHVVDVFLSPITTKTSAKGVQSRWIQTSAPLKALCQKHKAEIMRRHPAIKPTSIDNKRCQGIALQSEWRDYLQSLGLQLAQKREKGSSTPDRVSPEEYALKARQAALLERETLVAQREAALCALREEMDEMHHLRSVEIEREGERLERWARRHGVEPPEPVRFENDL